MQVQVSDQPLTAFGVRDDGGVLGCGTADGCCSVMQLSSALVEMVPNEKQTINAMFERETLRCDLRGALQRADRLCSATAQQAPSNSWHVGRFATRIWH